MHVWILLLYFFSGNNLIYWTVRVGMAQMAFDGQRENKWSNYRVVEGEKRMVCVWVRLRRGLVTCAFDVRYGVEADPNKVYLRLFIGKHRSKVTTFGIGFDLWLTIVGSWTLKWLKLNYLIGWTSIQLAVYWSDLIVEISGNWFPATFILIYLIENNLFFLNLHFFLRHYTFHPSV